MKLGSIEEAWYSYENKQLAKTKLTKTQQEQLALTLVFIGIIRIAKSGQE
jgi:hypothetical protein